jgi:hypothetical protein
MALTLQETRTALESIEPNYDELVKLGVEAMPFLEILMADRNVFIAAKATYLASMLRDPGSEGIVERAAQSGEPRLRMAAAAGAGNLRGDVTDAVLLGLLGDQDLGVRKVAMKSIPPAPPAELRQKVIALAETDPDPDLRNLARQIAHRWQQTT